MPALYRSEGDGYYSDVSLASGLHVVMQCQGEESSSTNNSSQAVCVKWWWIGVRLVLGGADR
jgi:hypothetical protein